MTLGTKRSISPLPLHLDNIKRTRTRPHKKDDRDHTAALTTSIGAPFRGQEIVPFPFPPSIGRASSHEGLNDLILNTTQRLSREGRRLNRAPQLLPDRIIFDWRSDPTAQSDSLRNLLSVTGIAPANLDRVLSRVKSRASSALTSTDLKPSHTAAKSRSTTYTPPTSQPSSGAASNPIVIEDDEFVFPKAGSSVAGDALWPSYVQAPSAVTRGQPPGSETTELPVPLRAASQRPITTTASVEDHFRSLSRQDACSSEMFRNDRSTERQGIMEPEAILPLVVGAVDRASVVSYATSPCPDDGAQQIMSEVTYGGQAAHRSTSQGQQSEENAGHSRPQSCSNRDSASAPSRRPLENRTADYGNWQSLASESSDAEMGDARPSSRESSPGRTFPSQAKNGVAGLDFLPQTYDVSGLALPSMSALGYQLGFDSDSDVAAERSTRSTHRRIRHESTQGGRHDSGQEVDTSLSSNLSPKRSSARRREPTRRNSGSLNASNDYTDDGNAIVIGATGGVPRDMPLPLASVPSGHLFGSQSGGFPGPSQGKRGRSSGHSNPGRPRRSSSSGHAASNSEESENEQWEQKGLTGHTVVIPKSDFARGRRLLAPGNQDLPIATILMRGDAHFIDQRRKTRITKWSLPVEDDLRHVEDACIIGESTIVVGYNRGPYQVSLIPVLEDQRPRRIDLTYRAHSSVIENRAAATSYPNPGIACLAPVSSDSFLSGGHDKTVRHWKVSSDPGQRARRAAYSARSVRLPTEHMQAVQALAFSSWNNAVYSAAGDRIATTRLDARAPSEPVRVSGKITQVHVHPQDQRLIALEIDHMDYQVHLYDTREGGFKRKPWLEFGYRAALPKPRSASTARSADTGNASVPKQGSRYIRGSTVNSLFARGYGDGAVLLWDYRNGGKKKVLERFHFQRPSDVAHTLLAGSDVIAYGGYSVTFWSTLSGQ